MACVPIPPRKCGGVAAYEERTSLCHRQGNQGQQILPIRQRPAAGRASGGIRNLGSREKTAIQSSRWGDDIAVGELRRPP